MRIVWCSSIQYLQLRSFCYGGLSVGSRGLQVQAAIPEALKCSNHVCEEIDTGPSAAVDSGEMNWGRPTGSSPSPCTLFRANIHPESAQDRWHAADRRTVPVQHLPRVASVCDDCHLPLRNSNAKPEMHRKAHDKETSAAVSETSLCPATRTFCSEANLLRASFCTPA